MQVLWHNGWRDAKVTRRMGEVEGVREYGVRFETVQGLEGEETVQFLQIMGALIRVIDASGGEHPLHSLALTSPSPSVRAVRRVPPLHSLTSTSTSP